MSLSEIERGWLEDGFRKLADPSPRAVALYPHERDALMKEFARLANFATLLGEPSPADQAGIDGHGRRLSAAVPESSE